MAERSKLCFAITLHKRDEPVLSNIQKFLGVGCYKKEGNALHYRVQSLKDIKFLINHFNKFPLLTQKRAEFKLFKKVFKLMERREHLTHEGLHKIVAIKASMNHGLSEKLQSEFKNIKPAERSLVIDQKINDPN